MRIRSSIIRIIASVLAAYAIERHALAADPVAESLFQRGLELFREKRFEESCAALQASQEREPMSGTLLLLASCQEERGLTASAWAAYRSAATLARGEGRTVNLQKAKARALALEPTLSHFTLGAPFSVGDVTLDGAAFVVGVKTAIDPGTHRLRAQRANGSVWTVEVTIQPGETIALSIPEEEPPPPPPEVKPTPAPPTPLPPPLPADKSEEPLAPPLPVWPWAIGATGLLLLGASAGGLALNIDKSAALDERCGPERDGCPPLQEYNYETDRELELVGLGLFIGAGVVGVGALTAAVVGLVMPVPEKPARVSFGLNMVKFDATF